MNVISKNPASIQEILISEKYDLIMQLGIGRTDGTAYDSAWVARLSQLYPHDVFASSLNWLRHHQYLDGSWGAPILQYHDRYISTLAAIITLSLINTHNRDTRRIKRGEDALWRMVGKLASDDHDTIGFPILSVSLTQEARQLGLEVPQPPVRFAKGYNKKVEQLLEQPQRNWRENTLAFSIEALRDAVNDNDIILEKNNSVGTSLSATAGYLLKYPNQKSLTFLEQSLAKSADGSSPALDPINVFEIAWTLNHLRYAGLIEPDDQDVQKCLDILWEAWSPTSGVAPSTMSSTVDIDDTAASFMVLQWGNYDVNADVFHYYECDDYFRCFVNETDPSVSAQLRLLAALRTVKEHPKKDKWISKILKSLNTLDTNGTFWTDKWHASPYYVNSTALWTLHGLDNTLVSRRLKWILRTQNDDGGWGYFGLSTPEETAYCLEGLLWWDRHVEQIDETRLSKAAAYLETHLFDGTFVPLWIGKSLYTPYYPIKAAIIGSLYSYSKRDQK